jgi:hypothetical protein
MEKPLDLDPDKLLNLLSVLDEVSIMSGHSTEDLEAHLIDGDIVEIRTTKGTPVMTMPRADYDAFKEVKLDGD